MRLKSHLFKWAIISMINPKIEVNKQALMNLYNFPLLLPSSSLISDIVTRFLMAVSLVFEAMVSHVMALMAFWAFRRRDQVNCFVLTVFSFFPVFAPFGSNNVNPLGFSTVTVTVLGAMGFVDQEQ
uniref:Uncharacterized protein n=1 Tax=Opuntia streptacantha TaxID=393608 RepID=A0A7C9CWM0_OPUST